jgi:predicted phage tail protein
MRRKIVFEGELGEKFGKETYIDASSFGDVIRCFSANFDNFKQYLLDCDKRQIAFICKVNNVAISEKELPLRYGEGDMVITPVPAGAFIKGIIKAVAGVVLVIVGAITGNVQLMIQGGMMAFSGIAEHLAPDPLGDPKDPDPDYLYSGTAQLILETDPIPICYGRMRVPAKPISFDIRTNTTAISVNAASSDNLKGARGGSSRNASMGKYTAAIAAVTEISA